VHDISSLPGYTPEIYPGNIPRTNASNWKEKYFEF
jgi:hypothetical protein